MWNNFRMLPSDSNRVIINIPYTTSYQRSVGMDSNNLFRMVFLAVIAMAVLCTLGAFGAAHLSGDPEFYAKLFDTFNYGLTLSIGAVIGFFGAHRIWYSVFGFVSAAYPKLVLWKSREIDVNSGRGHGSTIVGQSPRIDFGGVTVSPFFKLNIGDWSSPRWQQGENVNGSGNNNVNENFWH